MRPKRSLSQVFLTDESVGHKIVHHFMETNTSRNVLEVGPGKGALTRFLKNYETINYKVIEADHDMAEYLVRHSILTPEQIIYGDFLKWPAENFFNGEPFSVIGNFPYHISTQILFRVFDYKEMVPLVVGMFQREVAERIVSGHGSKVYGVTSVILQSAYEAKLLFHVNPGSFFPRPKVTSSVIALKRKEEYEVPCNSSLFRAIVKASFNQRRKMLRNSIKSWISEKSLINHEMMSLRPEQLSLQDYYALTNLIENQ